MLDVKLGDIVRLKKAHPCGSFEWRVYRIGADIGIRCLGCSHTVMLERRELERRTRAVLAADAEAPASPRR